MTEVFVRPLQEHLSQKDGYNFTEFTASMPAGSKFIDLKKEIHKRWELHPKQQKLTHDNRDTDDRKLLSESSITSANPVFVELISTSIQLSVVGLGGIRVEVYEDLNQKLSALRITAFGDAKCRARDQVKLVFKGRELDWEHQLRTVQGLEDGSELCVSLLPHIILTIATQVDEVDIPDVDLNLTVWEFKEKYLNPSNNRSGDHRFARVATELKKTGWTLCFGKELDLNRPLRTIHDLDNMAKLTVAAVIMGG